MAGNANTLRWDGSPGHNSEVASMRVHVWERAQAYHGWKPVQTLVAPGRAHFEYAQRTPVPGLELQVT